MAPTAKALAKALNLSASTVSMVLNNRPGISEQTRQLVLKEAEKMGLNIPSRRTPAGNPTYIYFIIYKKHGKVVSDTPFFSQLIEGIESETKKYGFRLQVTYFYGNADAEDQLSTIKASGSSGLLILATEMNSGNMDMFASLNLPTVVLDAYFERRHHDTIVINNVQGAYNAISYLVNHGHQQIGYLRSKIRIKNFLEREDGFCKTLGMHQQSDYIFDVEPTSEGAYHDMKALLEKSPKLPTAFFADNDIIAISCIKALKEKGIRVPEDISVIGFDDIMPLCEIIEPRLTTMRVPKQRLGMLAVERLITNINNETKEIIKLEVSTELVERDSVLSIEANNS